MSEWQNIGVALDAKVSGYVAGLERAGVATKNFARDLTVAATGAKDFESASQKMDQVGGKLTRNVTLPVVAAGVVVTKLASDFNTTFTKMTSLAGVPGDKLDELKTKVLALSHETAQSPRDLAEALYQIESSGVSGAQALEVLKSSAQASAIGLGETAQVADAVTSALNTYRQEGLTAAQATDVLVAAVRTGKGEASEFAPQLGRLLPLAENLGIGFGGVAGALAFLTRTSGDTSLSATMLTGVMAKLLKPTSQGSDELKKVGLSAEGLRQTVAQKGLLPALQLLNDRFAGNRAALGRFFDDIQGLEGFLSLLSQGGAPAAAAIDDVTNSAGDLGTAFKGLQDTDAFKMKQGLADLQAEGVKLGERLLPIVSDIVGGVTHLIDVFDELPKSLQVGILGFVGFAAALGPVLKLAGNLGKLGSGTKGLVQGLKGVETAGGGAANSLGLFMSKIGPGAGVAAGGVLVGFSAILYGLEQNAANAAKRAAELKGEIDGVISEMQSANKSAREVFRDVTIPQTFRDNGDLLRKFKVDAKELYDAVTGSSKGFQEFYKSLIGSHLSGSELPLAKLLYSLRASYVGARQGAKDQAAAEATVGAQADEAAGSVTNFAGANAGLTGSSEDVTSALDDQYQRLADIFAAGQRAESTHRSLAQAMEDLATKQRAAAGDSDEMRRARQGEVDAEKALTRAHRDSLQAQQDLGRARADAAVQLRDLSIATRSAALGEEGAQIALLRAKDAVEYLPPDATDLDRREAELQAKQAQLGLESAHNQNVDTAKQYADAKAKGIEGSDAVVAAKQRIIDTAEAEQDAERRVGEASQEVSALRVKAQKDVEDATRTLHDAELDDIQATADLATKAHGAAAGHDALLIGLLKLTATLDPNSPLRQRLADYIDQLAALNGGVTPSAPPTIVGPGLTGPASVYGAGGSAPPNPGAGPFSPSGARSWAPSMARTSTRAPGRGAPGTSSDPATPAAPAPAAAGNTTNIYTADPVRYADQMWGPS